MSGIAGTSRSVLAHFVSVSGEGGSALRMIRVPAAAFAVVFLLSAGASGPAHGEASAASCDPTTVVKTVTSAADWLADPTAPLSSTSVTGACGTSTSAAPASTTAQGADTATGGGTVD